MLLNNMMLTVISLLFAAGIPNISANPIPTTRISPTKHKFEPRALASIYFSEAVTLSPSNQPNLCLGTEQPPANDVYLYLIPCDTPLTWYGAWEIVSGNNPGVRLSGTKFCLDAGVNPYSGGPSKLYTCTANTPQQTWYYTSDSHIAITGGTQCLDYAVVCGLGGCSPGTEACGSTINQQWNATPVTGGKTGVQLHPNGDVTKCLTPSNLAATDGTPLFMSTTCIPAGQPYADLQLWDISLGTGAIRLHGTNECLDAGSSPANGVTAKLWTCYPGLNQQTWVYTNDLHIANLNGNQCLDLRAEDGVTVQTYQCGTSNQQIWST